MERLDCLVIGAGVIGLAVARALALAGREVVIVERHGLIGSETSSRNSEVIHAGLYYPDDYLKTRLCVEGRHRLYAYCDSHGVPHRKTGKLVVAETDGQLKRLEALRAQAIRNGVSDVVMVSADEARAMEPELACVGAMHSPSSGIIDSHSLMLALLGDAEAAGAMLALDSPVEGGRVTYEGIEVSVGGAAPMTVLCNAVVNCAGLCAQDLARSIAGVPEASIPPIFYAKGTYFRLAGRPPFSRLIYPMPEPGGLGVHVTLDLGGQVRFGPDVEWVDTLDYDVDRSRGERFYAAIRSYWPALPDGALEPDYTGIRPKLARPDNPRRDFMIQGPPAHGIAGLVNLYGVESPGLTACLAIADRAAHLLIGRGAEEMAAE
jgi:L-2-hydroxyglutarate oxidase LhgO